MKDRVKEIVEKNPQVKSYTVYDRPVEGDVYDKKGFINFEWLSSVIPSMKQPSISVDLKDLCALRINY